MSLRLTDSEHVAIYESVSGCPIAGLAVFGSAEDAESFIAWHAERYSMPLAVTPPGSMDRILGRWIREVRDAD